MIRSKTNQPAPAPQEVNPLLPTGYDIEDDPEYVHPDLRPYWGLDEDNEHGQLADTGMYESWVWRRHMWREYQRCVTEEGWLPDMAQREYQGRLEHAGYTPPRPTPEDRPAYVHAVRESYAVERLQRARRTEEHRALQAAAQWCELGRHSHPTTSRRPIRDIWVNGCDECAPGVEARVTRLHEELVNEDGVTRGERNDEWIASHRDELLAVAPRIDLGRIIAANMVNAGGLHR